MSEDETGGTGTGASGAAEDAAGPETEGPDGPDAPDAAAGASPSGEAGPAEGTRERIEERADRAVEEFDERAVEALAWVLDTETRARIYVNLRRHPGSTSEEVADGTGLYPSTVREALAALAEEGTVTREKRDSAGAGNNPYEYRAIAPSELVQRTVGQLQEQLNAVCRLDALRDGAEGEDAGDADARDADDGPVTIEVESGEEGDADERSDGA